MTQNTFCSLENQIALVTGSSRGIGKATARALAAQGAKVAINYRNSKASAEELAAEIIRDGGEAVIFQADVSNFEDAKSLIENTIEHFGSLQILVNNAGITRDKLIMMMKEDDWDTVLNINAKGTFNCSKAAVRHMMRKRFGRIINITSVSGQMGNAGQTNYSASKAAQIGFTKALAREVAARNITVNAIAAGIVDTNIWDGVPEDIMNELNNMVPLKRKGIPQDIANAVVFLASDQASYITGQVLAVDGGLAMF